MTCLQFRPGKRWRIAAGAALLAPVAWLMLLAVVPTECARRKIADRMSRSIGRKVTLGRLRVCVFGGVSLGDLTVGAAAGDDSPWLRVGEASIDVSLWQLLLGHVEPTAVEVQGLSIRVLRRRDGSLEMAEVLRPDPVAPGASPDPDAPREPKVLAIAVRDATVLAIDEPTGTRLEFTGVQGRGTYQGTHVSVTDLRGTLNGGTVELAAQVDGTDARPRFEGQARLRGVKLGDGMNALAYLSPVLAGVGHSGLDGKLALDLYLRGQGASHAALRETLVGQGRLALDPVALDGSRLLAGVADLFDLPPRGRVGAVRTDFKIDDGRVASENLTVDVARVPAVFEGWTDFDGRVDYRLRTEGLIEKLPPRAQEFLGRLRPGLKLDDLGGVKIGGTVDALVITSRGVPITRGEDRKRLQQIGRQVRDRLRR